MGDVSLGVNDWDADPGPAPEVELDVGALLPRRRERDEENEDGEGTGAPAHVKDAGEEELQPGEEQQQQQAQEQTTEGVIDEFSSMGFDDALAPEKPHHKKAAFDVPVSGAFWCVHGLRLRLDALLAKHASVSAAGAWQKGFRAGAMQAVCSLHSTRVPMSPPLPPCTTLPGTTLPDMAHDTPPDTHPQAA